MVDYKNTPYDNNNNNDDDDDVGGGPPGGATMKWHFSLWSAIKRFIEKLTFYHHSQFAYSMPLQVEKVLNYLVLIRRFDIMILSKLLPAYLPESYREDTYGKYLDLISELLRSGQVRWTHVHEGYVVDPVVLKNLPHTLEKEWKNKDYLIFNDLVISIYSDRLEAEPSNQPFYLVEMLYHKFQAMLLLEIPLEDIRVQIQDIAEDWLDGLIDGNENLLDLQLEFVSRYENDYAIRALYNDDATLYSFCDYLRIKVKKYAHEIEQGTYILKKQNSFHKKQADK